MVVLPLDPVTARTRPRQTQKASSISGKIGIPAAVALPMISSDDGTPGELFLALVGWILAPIILPFIVIILSLLAVLHILRFLFVLLVLAWPPFAFLGLLEVQWGSFDWASYCTLWASYIVAFLVAYILLRRGLRKRQHFVRVYGNRYKLVDG